MNPKSPVPNRRRNIYPAAIALTGWIAYFPFMFVNKLPWYAYLITGIFFLIIAYIWSLVIWKLQITNKTLIVISAAAAVILIGTLGIYFFA